MLNALNPDVEYYFILGSDSIMSFLSWYRPDIILKYAKLLTVRRDDESFDLMDSKIKEIEDNSVVVEIASGVKIKVDKNSIYADAKAQATK